MGTQITKTETLFCQDGTADKVYTLQIVKTEEKFLVQAQWGRRGNVMQCGNKTLKPVTFDVAKKIFDKIIKEKLGKGYHPGRDL